MSIAAAAIGAQAIAAQPRPTSKVKGGPPPRRTVVATADAIAQPEAR
jgi:hypothetical protein